MIQKLFFTWFECLDLHIERTLGVNILLVTENWSTYGLLDIITKLERVTVQFSSQNKTSKLQLLDTRKIEAEKRKYCCLLSFWSFQNIDWFRAKVNVKTWYVNSHKINIWRTADVSYVNHLEMLAKLLWQPQWWKFTQVCCGYVYQFHNDQSGQRRLKWAWNCIE